MRQLYDLILGISIIVALTQYRQWKTDKLILIGLLLVLTGIVEYFGAYMSSKNERNEWLYNIFFVIEFSTFIFSILKKINSQFYKNTIFFCTFFT